MRLIGLQAENIKKLKLVSVKFDQDKPVITISGANEQGKSTFLDCFEYAMSGTKSLKDVSMPIRMGEDHAKVVVETDEITVTRTWTATGNTYLKVTNKEGWEPKGGAQALLDKLYSAFSFDPLAFSQMEDKKQLDVLLKLVNISLDLTKWGVDRKKIFDSRTEVNRQVTDLEGQLKLMADVPVNTPDEEIPAAMILQEQAEAQKVKEENDRKRRDFTTQNDLKRRNLRNSNDEKREALEIATDELENLAKEKASHDEKILALQEEINIIRLLVGGITLAVEEKTKEREMLKADVDTLIDPNTMELPGMESLGLIDPDMTVFAEKIKNVEETNRLVRVKKKKAESQGNYATKKAESDAKTTELATMDKQKADALAAAKFPIEGLSFNESGILYKGIPFNQCSSAERLRVSTAMGMAMNPKFRAMFIRDASLLDSRNKAMIAKMADENGFVVFMEVADDTGKLGIFIEDGEVKAIDGEPFKLEAEEVAHA